nr:immunoglobulin heavy chain junction region [Macaca mulatta]
CARGEYCTGFYCFDPRAYLDLW